MLEVKEYKNWKEVCKVLNRNGNAEETEPLVYIIHIISYYMLINSKGGK